MTSQAQNSLNLYRGCCTDTIEMALRIQNKSVVNELMEYFNAHDIHELAIRLSIGK